MNKKLQILCVGSVVWDIIGRSNNKMSIGTDQPGKIIKIPGGVALNLAMNLQKNKLKVAILGVVGDDPEGNALIQQIKNREIKTNYIYISKNLPTDTYMAVEGSNGLIGAIADSNSLETHENEIECTLKNIINKLPHLKFAPLIALDGNLTEKLLIRINSDPTFKNLDMRIAPASPGKAKRLSQCLDGNISTIYVNLEEANLILNKRHLTSETAAKELIKDRNLRVIVTDGGKILTLADKETLISVKPPRVKVTRVTGAGDIFMASHIKAEILGQKNMEAIEYALNQTAKYISSSDIL